MEVGGIVKGLRQSWICGALLITWGIMSVFLTALAIILAAPFLGGVRAFFKIGPLWARQIFRIGGIKLEVEGWDELPEAIRSGQQPVIFMSNHQSNLDPPVLIATIPVPAVYISKKELKWVPFVGWASQLAGVIFIDRGNREKALLEIKRAAQEIQGGKNVVIFPEGTRTRNGELGPFKKGGFALAQQAEVPIVPMATVGGFEILPAGSLRLGQGTYRIRFGQPVNPDAYEHRDQLIAEVRSRVEAMI
jgi:1-acyl-sn-glycerol-3-phosphate acyltransferase